MKIKKKHKIKLIIAVILVTAYYFSLPKQLFKNPTSTVIESAEGYLLGAKIALDGQWRFPYNPKVPQKFKTCILQFEDAYFYKHFGFNPVAIAKAIYQNIKVKKIVRGASTITQQVIRLSRKNKKRTYFEKVIEIILATRLEFKYSKNKILSLYTSNAPFGGNVVGLDMAAWRYFGRKPSNLSWAESATLAVLPNAPSLIYPGKNKKKLKEKRNSLLLKLYQNNYIDKITYELSILEELPEKPFRIPKKAPHLLQRAVKEHQGKRIKTSLQLQLQERVNTIVARNYLQLSQNKIHNISVLVLDIESRKVLSYVGNSPTTKKHQKDVDIVTKPRSTGSILKPFLYAAMLDAGDILPNTLIADVPTEFGSYKPQNFNKKFSGAVFASKALAKSLNVPSVRMLQDFGLDRFYFYLKKLKLKDLKYPANHYGLSLILGGAESNLWDLCKSYASMASTVNHYDYYYGKYFENEFLEPSYLHDFTPNFGKQSTEKTLFDAGSIYLTLEALNKVNRPEGEENWEFFNSSNKIAWKTGTSYGFRDAWAIGVSKKYVVGVWVGNADGEGRTGLVGINTAAPILFEIFNYLPKADWFALPFDELAKITVCSKSGYRALPICDEKEEVYVQVSGLKTKPCPYHKWVHLDKEEQFQVNTSCEKLSNIVHKSWFILPPLMEYYYKQNNPFYKTLPNFRNDCSSEENKLMQFVIPQKNNTKFYLTKDFTKKNKIVLKAVHTNLRAKIYWYLNKQFLGTTKEFHEMQIPLNTGVFKVTIVDEQGNELTKKIQILE